MSLLTVIPGLSPATVLVGSNTVLSNRVAIVLAPLQVVLPSIVIKASSFISSCADWTLDLTATTGSTGRSWVNTSVSVSSGSINASNTLETFMRSALTTTIPFTVPNQMMVQGERYSVVIQLCNLLGGCNIASTSVFVSNTSLSAPIVSILGASTLTTYVNRSLSLSSQAYTPLCGGLRRTSGLSYAWTIRDSQGAALPASYNRALDPSTLQLAAYTLKANSSYTAQLAVSDIRSGLVTTSSSVNIVTLISDLVVRISPAVPSKLGVGQSVILDASSSYDPDRSVSTSLTFIWDVYTLPVMSPSRDLVSITVSDKSATSLRSVATVAATEAMGNITAYVRVSVTYNARSFTLVQPFTVVSEALPVLSILTPASSVSNVDITSSVVLSGSILASVSTEARWMLVSGQTALGSSTLSSDTVAGDSTITLSANRATFFSLYLLPNVLLSGSTYVFQLVCGSVSVSIPVVTNSPPYGGTMSVSPLTGSSLQTSFLLSANGWLDSNLPLQYSFRFFASSSSSWLSLQGAATPSSYCSSTLPAGSVEDSYRTNLTVVVYDSYGASSVNTLDAVQTVRVEPVPIGQAVSLIASMLGNASTPTDVQQIVSVGSAVLNTVNCSQASASYCSAINRQSCAGTSHTCGSCLDGYTGSAGDGNDVCYPLSTDRRRLGTFPSGIDILPAKHRVADRSCRRTSDCLSWEVCNTNTRVCTDRSKTCSQDCSGRGTCSFKSSDTGLPVDTCTVLATNCIAVCACSEGYGGSDCAQTVDELTLQQTSRGSLLTSLQETLAQTNLNAQSVASLSDNLHAVVQSSWSLTDAAVTDALTLSQTLFSAAADSSTDSEETISASKVRNVLSPLDKTISYLLGSNETANNSSAISSLRSIVDLVAAYASLSAEEALPGASESTVVQDNYRLTTKAFSLVPASTSSRDPIMQLSNVSVRLFSPRTPLEEAMETPVSSLRVTQINGSSATAVHVNMVEYPQQLLSRVAANTSSNLLSNVLSIAASAVSSESGSYNPVTYEVEIMHTNQSVTFDSDPESFEVNCSYNVARSVDFLCSGSNVTLTLTCDGTASGTIRRYCPMIQPTCKTVQLGSSSSQSANVVCQTTSFTSVSTKCTCQQVANTSASNRRRRLDSVVDQADHIAVMTLYVTGSFRDTFTVAKDFSNPAAFSRSYIVITLYGSVWAVAALLMVTLYYKAKDQQAKKHQKSQQQRQQSRVVGFAGSTSSGRNGDGDQYSVRKMRIKLLKYVESVVPKVFEEKPTILRLAEEMTRSHVYLKLVREGLSSRRSYIDIFQMMTSFTVLMFLLALLYDLQYPSDDGSCVAHTTEKECLAKKSLMDETVSFCLWHVRSSLGDGTCEFNRNPDVSFKDAAICAVVSSWFTSVLVRPLDFLFELLLAPSVEELATSAQAHHAFTQLQSAVGIGPGRTSLAPSNRALHAVLPAEGVINNQLAQKKQLMLHTTHIPEDTQWARREVRILLHGLENDGGSRQLSHSAVRASSRSARSGRSVSAGSPFPITSADGLAGSTSVDERTALTPHQVLQDLYAQRDVLLQIDAMSTSVSDDEESHKKCTDFDRMWQFVLEIDPTLSHLYASDERKSIAVSRSTSTPHALSSEEIITDMMAATTKATLKERRKLASLSDIEVGLGLLQNFIRDILGRKSSIARIYAAKAQHDFYQTKAVSRWLQVLAVVVIVLINLFCLAYAIFRGYQKGLAWQQSYAVSCVVQIATEIVFFETLETLWVDFMLPNFAYREVRRCHKVMRQMIDNLSELITSSGNERHTLAPRTTPKSQQALINNQPLSFNSPKNQLERSQLEDASYGATVNQSDMVTNDAARDRDSNSHIVLNVPEHFYVSHQLALRYPQLMESRMVLSYESYLPFGLSHQKKDKTSSTWEFFCGTTTTGSHKRSWYVQTVALLSTLLLTLVATIPFEFHRLVIRFFSPFIVGGFVLAWAFVTSNAVNQAVFTFIVVLAAVCMMWLVRKYYHALGKVQHHHEDVADVTVKKEQLPQQQGDKKGGMQHQRKVAPSPIVQAIPLADSSNMLDKGKAADATAASSMHAANAVVAQLLSSQITSTDANNVHNNLDHAPRTRDEESGEDEDEEEGKEEEIVYFDEDEAAARSRSASMRSFDSFRSFAIDDYFSHSSSATSFSLQAPLSTLDTDTPSSNAVMHTAFQGLRQRVRSLSQEHRHHGHSAAGTTTQRLSGHHLHDKITNSNTAANASRSRSRLWSNTSTGLSNMESGGRMDATIDG